LGGRGRQYSSDEREKIIKLIDVAVTSGARLQPAAKIIGLSSRTIIRWRKNNGGQDRRKGPLSEPPNKLDKQERQEIIDVANRPEYRDMSPNQIVPKLADKGIYLASESSFYRILKEQKMVNHRLNSKPSVNRYRPEEKVASGPGQVWSWDITYLRSPTKGSFYYLYMFIDIWSRKIMAAQVFNEESMELSAELFTQACFVHGIRPEGLILHSDNGGPMKGSTMLATLQQLGVVPSFSRPKVSDDNPYSESLFRTMKYRPEYPGKAFQSLEQAQDWVDDFTCWYNTSHLHSSIRFITPDDRHYGRSEDILTNRREVYEKARRRNPNRWSRRSRNWDQIQLVCLNPENNNSVEQKQPLKKVA
jgi:transposase InsO family protein